MRGRFVTIVDNKTGEEVKGFLQKFTREEIVILQPVKYDATKVHFKKTKK